MTPRDAIQQALARHVWENDPEFEQCVEEFMEDLDQAGFAVVPKNGKEEDAR